MKKVIILALVIFSAPTFAQFQLGARAGVNLQSPDVDNFNGLLALNSLSGESSQIGFHAGIYTRVSLVLFHIQPELLFTRVTNKMTATNFTGAEVEVDASYNRFDIPVLLGKKIGPVRLVAGPVVSFNLGGDNSIEDGLTANNIGYQAGVGLDLLKYRLEIRYEGSFGGSIENINIGGTNFITDTRISQIMIGLGYNFL